MQLKPISETVTVTGQIHPDDIDALKGMGFLSIMCNRPDGEDVGQPLFADVARAARAAGMEVRHVPIIPGQLTQADVDAFAKALDEMPAPLLAYCRSGARCEHVWMMT